MGSFCSFFIPYKPLQGIQNILKQTNIDVIEGEVVDLISNTDSGDISILENDLLKISVNNQNG